MAINEQVGKQALAEPKKFLDNLIFKDVKHFVKYFIKKGFFLAYKPMKILGKKSYKIIRHKITNKHTSELSNKSFLKKVGSRNVREHYAYEISGLKDKDLEKVSIEDVKKPLAKHNINFTLVKNSYNGEIKFKNFNKLYKNYCNWR